ncbi:LmeA family phospholipid-binding protein [Nocardia sp. NPDC004340]
MSSALAVTLVAACGVAAEIYYRDRVERCVAAQAQRELGSSVTVGFGARPLLLAAIDHHIPSMTLDTENAAFGPAVGMQAQVNLKDVDLADKSSSGASVTSSRTTATWSDTAILSTLRGLASEVTSQPDTNSITVQLLTGLAAVELRPYAADGKIQIETVSSRGVPAGMADRILGVVAQSLQDYPLNQQPTDITVTPAGLRIQLAGGFAELPGSTGSC